jgi:hypothetical protein
VPAADAPPLGRTLKIYKGVRGADGVGHVYVTEAGRPDQLLAPRTDLFMRSSAGLDWGYSGSGPAQCALAILADALGDDLRAVRVHTGFHLRVVAVLPRHLSWQVTQAQVTAAVEDIERNVPEE